MTPGRDAVQAALAEFVSQGRMPGATWWVERAGRVTSRGAVGVTSIVPPGLPVTEATPYDLASLTKPLVTAPLLALLEQEGQLALDDSLASHLSEFEHSRWGATSLLALLSHTSGLPAWKPLYASAADLPGFLAAIARTEPAGEPGATLYSDLGYIALGAVIERVLGERLPQAWQRCVAGLGLQQTGFPDRETPFAHAAPTECGNAFERRLAETLPDEPHRESSESNAPWRSEIPPGEVHDGNAHALGGAAGHAGLFGVASEVARIARWLLGTADGPLGDRARARLLTAVEGSEGRTAGLVQAFASRAAAGALPDEAPGHTGFSGTSLWLEPQTEAIFVLLTNRVHPRVDGAGFQDVRHRFHALAWRQVEA